MSMVISGPDGRQMLVIRRDGWWVVLDQKTREPLSGGFRRSADAATEARRLLSDGVA